jgi:hypothetical protein
MEGQTMSEVDRLSTSGTYPALPMAGKRRAKEQFEDTGSRERRGDDRDAGARDRVSTEADPGQPRSSSSLIDEYA